MSATPELEAQMLVEARAEVALADQKAGIVLASTGIGFAAVLGGFLAGDWRPGEYNTFGEVLWWIAAALAFSTIASAAAAIWPRYTIKNEENLISYWGHVARYESLESLVAALDSDAVADTDRFRHQLYRLSRLVVTKYRCVRWSMRFGAGAAGMFVVAGLIG